MRAVIQMIPQSATQLPASGQCSIGLKTDEQINESDPEINRQRWGQITLYKEANYDVEAPSDPSVRK